MTVVVLPYSDRDADSFYIYLEGNLTDGFIHEFRISAAMDAWFTVQGFRPLSTGTLNSEWGGLEILSHMEFTFATAEQAVLFKLTWL